MFLKYFYNRELSHASYMVGCQATGEAIVVDPGRDVEPYLQEALAQDLRIIAATETHIHADFVSGSRELAARAGAMLYLSDEGDENWKYQFIDDTKHRLVKDGDSFMIGNIQFEVLHTPGHTPEHISFVVTDTPATDLEGGNRPMGILTGDFVFVGDIGRPDLLEEAAGLAGTAEPGARQMFRSLKRFSQLPDYMQVWPAHGAGSACGKALGAIPSSTVGYEKLFNWAFAITDEDEFVRTLLADQPEAPRYFAMMKRLNKEGPPVLHGLPIPSQLRLEQLKTFISEGRTVVDVRNGDEFAGQHIPGTINIPYDSAFTTWAGWMLKYDEPFYLLADADRVADIERSLVSIGLDNLGGVFDSSMLETWAKSAGYLQAYDKVAPSAIADKVINSEYVVVDVRSQSEWDAGHIPGAMHMMLGYLPELYHEIDADRPVVVQCQTGSRSAIGASILQAKGIPTVVNMTGGLREWASAKLPVTHNGAL